MTDDARNDPYAGPPGVDRAHADRSAATGHLADTGAPHLSIDELADLGVDALDDAAAERARAHLDSCAECRTGAAELAAVSGLLAAVPAVAMPADVIARIEASLREAASELVAAARAETPAGHTVEATAADATDVRMGAVQADGTPSSRSDDQTNGATAATVTSLASARDRRQTRTRLRRAAAAAVGVAAVLGGGLLFGQLVGLPNDGASDSVAGTAYSDTDAAESGAAPNAPDERVAAEELATESGTAYTAADLVPEVRELLTRDGGSDAGGSAAPDSTPPSTTAVSPDPLAPSGSATDFAVDVSRCVDAVTERARTGAVPLAVDIGSYEGARAVVVVLPAKATATGDIWVVSADCLTDEDPLEVLVRQPLPSVRGTG